MPVIINDFEIMLEPPPQADPGAAGNAQPTVAVAPSPEQIAFVVRWQAERASRTRSG